MQDNPKLSPRVRVFAIAVATVLLGGSLLLLHPSVMVPRWPWQLSPFTARFLGAFYLAEMSAVVILAVINRWSPGRLLLIVAVSFTTIISLVSLWHIDRFNFGRLGPWAWFFLYVGSAFIAAAFLWSHWRLPHPGRPLASPAWRTFFVVQALLLGAQGLYLLVAPEAATSFWPWKVASFDAQLYSSIFLSGGLAAYVLSRSPARAELASFGLSEVILGVLVIFGLYLADTASKTVNWTAPGTQMWIAGYVVLVVFGAISMALAARRPA